jgi:hypothetical protein
MRQMEWGGAKVDLSGLEYVDDLLVVNVLYLLKMRW